MALSLTFHGKTTGIQSLGLGVFDGVHLGHQHLLNQCDALLTFNPHPASIIKGATHLKRLTTLDEMTYYIPDLISLEFTPSIAQLSADTFLNTILLDRINPASIVIGYDYFFGKNKEGTPEYLKKWGETHDIPVTIVDPIMHTDYIVKSKAIRTALMTGNAQDGLDALGHPYLMKGTVIKGDHRGHSLGFPTANLCFPTEKLIPKHGIYKGSILLDDTSYKAMIYIGNKPTFGSESHAVEVFILDFSDDIYGDSVSLFIEQFIRPEKAFDSTEALIEQIKRDIHTAYGN